MASKKMASTFTVWNLTMGLKKNLNGAAEYCKSLGLEMKQVGGPGEFGVVFSLIIPCCACESPADFVAKELAEPFEATLISCKTQELMYPLP